MQGQATANTQRRITLELVTRICPRFLWGDRLQLTQQVRESYYEKLYVSSEILLCVMF
jgi:hypothetical protein